jgi:hypothetical protein|tara:strand:+ start:3163 stop:3528 length:366 start_codon:yes stop_codon:yes gene_type:complete
MKSEDLIHLKFEYNEALQSKRNILYSEKNLIMITKKINNYLSLREDELKSKIKLHRKIKEMLTTIRKLQKIVPKIEVPKILKKESPEPKEKIKIKPKRKKDSDHIESQLQEIQEKLNTLQR